MILLNMKNKVFFAVLILLTLFFANHLVYAESVDPIKATIQSSPEKVDGVRELDISITITNVGNETSGAIVLFSPDGKRVLDFGEKGEITLAEGSSKTYTGKWTLKQSDLESGEIKYYIKYPIKQADGSESTQNKFLSAKFEYTKVSSDVNITREITPLAAKKGQEVSVVYTITNNGTEAIRNFHITENSSISKEGKSLASIPAGEEKKITFTVKMGTKNLRSAGKATWKIGNESKSKTFDSATITYGEAKLSAKLTSSETGILAGSNVVLSLALNNTGTVAYTNINVTDATLGEVFSGESLAAGASLTLDKEITVESASKYQFIVTATDATGETVEIKTGTVEIKTILESEQLSLSVSAVADKDVFYDDGGRIKFTISVTNNSLSDAKNVTVFERDVNVYTFALISPGQTKTVARDFTLTQSGKYRFDARARNKINEMLTFEGNEIYIEVIAPTAVPIVITPSPLPPLVTLAPKTWEDAPASFESTGKLLNTLAMITGGIAAVLLTTVGLSLALRANYVSKSKNVKASIKKLKPKRNYYQQATVEEITPGSKPTTDLPDKSSFLDNEAANEAPFADMIDTPMHTSADAAPSTYRRRSPGDNI